eukprot:4667558-Pleurochrysis_carterae.AAC.1
MCEPLRRDDNRCRTLYSSRTPVARISAAMLLELVAAEAPRLSFDVAEQVAWFSILRSKRVQREERCWQGSEPARGGDPSDGHGRPG